MASLERQYHRTRHQCLFASRIGDDATHTREWRQGLVDGGGAVSSMMRGSMVFASCVGIIGDEGEARSSPRR